jgi:hypothetical protein
MSLAGLGNEVHFSSWIYYLKKTPTTCVTKTASFYTGQNTLSKYIKINLGWYDKESAVSRVLSIC